MPGLYPRVGGGNPGISSSASTTPGLSPRGRGKRVHRRFLEVVDRSIPAWAGETGVRTITTT